jgi:opacity protein-like surface antigen
MIRLEASLGYGRNGLNGTFAQNVQAFVPCGETATNPCLAPTVDGRMRSLTGFGMAYVDIPTAVPVTPYIGAGIGFVRTDLDVGTQGRLNSGTTSRFAIIDGADTVLGYRAAAGVARSLGPAEVSLGYTFTRTAALSLPGRGPLVSFTFNRPITTHSFTAGVTYKF